jgi:DNA-binding winged helix-turn-helix (wHTH) protein
VASDGKHESSLRFDLFELDAKNRQLRRSGVLVDLPPQALRILVLLAARPNSLVTRQEIKETLWPEWKGSYEDLDQRLNFSVKKLREALGDDAEQPRYVQTVRNAGYMFIAPVRESVDPATVSSGAPVSVVVSTEAADREPTLRWWQRGLWVWAAVACALAVSAYGVWHEFHGGPVAQAGFSRDTLVARDGRGAALWTYDFDQPLAPAPDAAQRVVISGLGPDRQRDVLAAVPFNSSDLGNSANDPLYCFSAHGKVRWHHVFDDDFRFGGHSYGPPVDRLTSNGDLRWRPAVDLDVGTGAFLVRVYTAQVGSRRS